MATTDEDAVVISPATIFPLANYLLDNKRRSSSFAAINAFWEKPVLARSHLKFWLGDLVISNRTSRHREEQNGEILAFMIGTKCFAWWSNEQLRRLAERRHEEREAQDAEWSKMKGGAGNNA